MLCLRHRLSVLFMLMVSCFFVSCDEVPEEPVEEQEKPEIILQSEKDMVLDPEGDNVTVSFSSAMPWTIELSSVSDVNEWISVDKKSGNKGEFSIIVVAEANDTGLKRTAAIAIMSEDITKTVTLTQESTELKAEDIVKNVGNEGGSLVWDIEFSGKYEVDVNVDWIEQVNVKSLEKAELVFDVLPNEGEARTGKVTLSGSGKKYVMTVNQDPAESQEEEDVFKLLSNRADVPADGGLVEVKISTNIEYKYDVTVDWVTEVDTKAVEEKTHVFDVEPNPTDKERVATLTFCAGTTCIPFTITQEAGESVSPYLEVDETELTIDADDAQGYLINVKSNAEWTVESSKSWCNVSLTRAKGDGSFEITCTKNTGTERKAVVTVSSGSLSCNINVTQRAVDEPEPEDPYLEVDGSELIFEANDALGREISVTSNADWTVSSSRTWCQVSPSSGKGNGTFEVTCTENTSDVDRRAVLTISSGSLSCKIDVTQKAAEGPATEGYLEITSTDVEFSAESSMKKLSVDSNEKWTVESDSWWCSVSPESGNGDTNVTIYVEANESASARKAELVFRSASCEVTVHVTQYGKDIPGVDPVLELDSYAYTWFVHTAAELEIKVTSNVDWKASSNVAWCTVSPTTGSGNGTVVVSVTENKTNKIREAVVTIASATITRQFVLTQPGSSGTGGFDEDDELDWDNN